MGYCYDQCLMDVIWTRVKGNNNMISYTIIVSVSISYSRCYILVSSSYSMTHLHYVQWIISSLLVCIYSIDIFLYPYALLLDVMNLIL